MSDPKIDPSALMGKALDGDQEAYRAFLKWASEFTSMIAKKRFYRWSLNSNEMVFDFVQEVLLAVHQKRHTYLRHLPVEPWLAGIVKFKSIDWLRKNIRDHKNINFEDPLDMERNLVHAEAPETDMGVDSDLEAAMSTLTPQQREVLELAKIQGLTIEEVSARTGLSGPAVKVTIHRVIKKLQKRFGGGAT